MENEKLNVEFVDVESGPQCCLVNGRPLIDEGITPDEEYFEEVKSFIGKMPRINIAGLADSILLRNLKGLNLAMFAFSAGRVAAMGSDGLCEKSLEMLMSKGSISTACRDGYKVSVEFFRDEMKAAVISLITFGILSWVMPHAQEIIMSKVMKGMMGGL